MKKSSLVLIVITCIGFLLSSCGKLSNITVTKRHYRSGFYVDLGSHKQRPVKHKTSEAKVSDTKTAAAKTTAEITSPATLPVSDKLKDNSAVAAEKTTPEPSPVLVSSGASKKKQAHKKESSKVYASTQDYSDIKMEMQADLLKNSIDSKENLVIPATSSSSASVPQWLLIVFAIILPPLAIGLVFGIIDKFWISCLLTLLFWIPGVIYAIYWVTKS